MQKVLPTRDEKVIGSRCISEERQISMVRYRSEEVLFTIPMAAGKKSGRTRQDHRRLALR